MTVNVPVLYSFRRCPYAMRARLALVASGITCELREIVLRSKPQAMLDASPKGTVPVLILEEGSVIDESLDIMLWALGHYDPLSWLKPEVGSRETMLELIEKIDGSFKHHLDRYKYATRYDRADPDEHFTAALGELEALEQRLSQSKYLFGSRVSLADQALFPFVRQFANTDLERFVATSLVYTRAWLEDRVASAEFKVAFGCKWKPWSEGDTPVLFP